MKSTLVTLLVFFITVSFAWAQTPGDWQAAKKQGATAVESGDCARAWDIIWPWARNGKIEARAILAGGVFAIGLTPPGSGMDAISRFRHALILAVHGAAEGDSVATELLYGYIRTEVVSEMGGRKMKQCLDAGHPPNRCVADAVKQGFVPSFEAYAQEIDVLSAVAGASAALCKGDNQKEAPPLPAEPAPNP